MLSLRFYNFRSFRDTGRRVMRPITVLVGANSSGKSSYLRFFPLLRQTVASSTRSPLLWFGPLVDFGNFEKIVRRTSGDADVGFEIELNVNLLDRLGRRIQQSDLVPLRIATTLRSDAGETYVSSIVLTCREDEAKIEITSEDEVSSLRCNGVEMIKHYAHNPLRAVPNSLFPAITLQSANQPDFDIRSSPMNLAIAKHLGGVAHNRTSPQKLLAFANFLSYSTTERMLSGVNALNLRYLQDLQPQDPQFSTIRRMLFAREISNLLKAAQRAMSSYAERISYLGPFRQDPARFYRQQELTVGQIDPHGENFAMFLRSLSQTQIADFSEFVQSHLGFGVGIDNDSSHVEIQVSETAGRDFNLIDMGYGFSQVLPVIAQCWLTSRREGNVSLLAIEQPELHLHPSHQAKLADMFVAVVDRQRRRPEFVGPLRLLATDRAPIANILIETHSEVLVSRLGELIETKILKAEDVSVLLFSKDAASGITSVEESEFKDDGTLTNWPVGFFAP